MPGSLRQYYSLAVFPTGRRLFALRKVRMAADTLSLEDLVSYVAERIGFDERVMVMEYDWTGARNRQSTARGNAAKIDNDLDRTVGAIHTMLRTAATTFAPDHPLAVKANEMLAELFPEGAAAITMQNFEEQLASLEVVKAKLTDKYAADLRAMGLVALVDQLVTLTGEFRVELKNNPVEEMKFSELRAARERGQEGLLQVFSRVLGTWNGSSEDDVKMRTTLLAGILDQNERIRNNLRRSRRQIDVDPETGTEMPAPEFGLDLD